MNAAFTPKESAHVVEHREIAQLRVPADCGLLVRNVTRQAVSSDPVRIAEHFGLRVRWCESWETMGALGAVYGEQLLVAAPLAPACELSHIVARLLAMALVERWRVDVSIGELDAFTCAFAERLAAESEPARRSNLLERSADRIVAVQS